MNVWLLKKRTLLRRLSSLSSCLRISLFYIRISVQRLSMNIWFFFAMHLSFLLGFHLPFRLLSALSAFICPLCCRFALTVCLLEAFCPWKTKKKIAHTPYSFLTGSAHFPPPVSVIYISLPIISWEKYKEHFHTMPSCAHLLPGGWPENGYMHDRSWTTGGWHQLASLYHQNQKIRQILYMLNGSIYPIPPPPRGGSHKDNFDKSLKTFVSWLDTKVVFQILDFFVQLGYHQWISFWWFGLAYFSAFVYK